MSHRTDFQTLLESVLGSDAVYFQPPPTVIMKYPCIVYERSNSDTKFADNYPYSIQARFKVTVIDRDPDSLIPSKIAKLQKCRFETHFTADNLNHDVFNIYF
jgi:hypothetical protein